MDGDRDGIPNVLAEAMARRGHAVTVLTLTPEATPLREEKAGNNAKGCGFTAARRAANGHIFAFVHTKTDTIKHGLLLLTRLKNFFKLFYFEYIGFHDLFLIESV